MPAINLQGSAADDTDIPDTEAIVSSPDNQANSGLQRLTVPRTAGFFKVDIVSMETFTPEEGENIPR